MKSFSLSTIQNNIILFPGEASSETQKWVRGENKTKRSLLHEQIKLQRTSKTIMLPVDSKVFISAHG